jgi:site-specific recombinase XerD
MAGSQQRKSASTNKHGAPVDDVDHAVEGYLQDLERSPLAARTRDAYGQHVRAYAAWLAGRSEPGRAISDPRGRDHAARDFKRHLKADRGWKPSSVNLALAAVDHFNRFLGLGPANVRREPLSRAAPRALAEEQQRTLLRAAEASRPRDRAIVTLLLYTALRLHELVALDVEDVSISARKGLVVVRSGKGDAYREVPLNRPCRDALAPLLTERRAAARSDDGALFVGPHGARLTARSVDRAVRGVAAQAGLELSAHTLRHTCVTNLVRAGNDLVLVAELAGHRRLETTRRYSLPSAADRRRPWMRSNWRSS